MNKGQKMNEEKRPWGTFEVISDTKLYKVKKLTIFRGQSISLQYHNYRNEIWHIISGKGIVVNYKKGEINQEFKYFSGCTFEIPQGNVHKIIANTETVVFEVCGEHCSATHPHWRKPISHATDFVYLNQTQSDVRCSTQLLGASV